MPRPATGRKVRDVREARELLATWTMSGEPMSSWCAQRGINWYSLSAYKGWPGRHGDSLVEIEVATTTVTASSSSSTPSGRYRIVLGERVVEIGDDFDDGVLRRIVQVVEAC